MRHVRTPFHFWNNLSRGSSSHSRIACVSEFLARRKLRWAQEPKTALGDGGGLIDGPFRAAVFRSRPGQRVCVITSLARRLCNRCDWALTIYGVMDVAQLRATRPPMTLKWQMINLKMEHCFTKPKCSVFGSMSIYLNEQGTWWAWSWQIGGFHQAWLGLAAFKPIYIMFPLSKW
jgi:hypothetical protein